jgi:catechol O-methyltransferase
MAKSVSIWRQALPLAAREAGSFLRSRFSKEPDRRKAALSWVRKHATTGDPESVLRALDRYAREQRFLMNVGDEKGPLLENLVCKAGSHARILELGSFVGYSAILMSRHLKPPGRLVSIDSSRIAREVSTEMAAIAGVADRTEFHDGGSRAVIPRLDEPFDLVFLDHWKNLYLPDLSRILERRLLRSGAVVVADNVGPMFGKNPYVPWIEARSDFESTRVESHVEYNDIDDAVLISRWKG